MVFEYLKTVSVGNADRFLVRLPSEPSAHYLHSERESSSLQGALLGTDLLFSLPACPLLLWYSRFQENLIRSQRWGWGGQKLEVQRRTEAETRVRGPGDSHPLHFSLLGFCIKIPLKKQNKTKQTPTLANAGKHPSVHPEAELDVGLEPWRAVLALGHESCQWKGIKNINASCLYSQPNNYQEVGFLDCPLTISFWSKAGSWLGVRCLGKG